MPVLDNEVGEVVGTVGDTEYRQVLLNPAVGATHVTPDGRTWVAVREGVVNGQVVPSPFTIHWKGTAEAEFDIGLELHGPSPSQLDAAQSELLQHPEVSRQLAGSRFQVLSFTLQDSGIKSGEPSIPNQVRLSLYDYTHNRTLVVTSRLGASETVEISEYGSHELPVRDEFDAAVNLLRQHADLGPRLLDGTVTPYRPMPPLVPVELPDGRIERNIAVGLNGGGDTRHRIVSVNLNRDHIIVDRLPDVAFPSNSNCGPPAVDNCAGGGSAQRANVTIKQGANTLWTFQVVRPSASSGTNGSAIELQHVRYKGKQVLYRAHVPILNIQYLNAGGGCGPTYRDWQNQEACFQATGTDPLPGFRLCSSPATTIFDTGSDSGNFRGVAIYKQGQEVVLVSELAAGWYRYISIWRFHADGTIRPRFAFGATDNPCTCQTHHHHVYWRFDFDIETAANNLVEEFNDPILVGNSHWHKKVYEIRRSRDAAHKRKWKVSNTVTGSGYELIPGANDGKADAYGIGDLWILRYKSSEIDDGQGFTKDPALSFAHLDKFKSPAELVENQDVVLWYSGHFLHDETHAGGQPHIIGPDLKPVNW